MVLRCEGLGPHSPAVQCWRQGWLPSSPATHAGLCSSPRTDQQRWEDCRRTLGYAGADGGLGPQPWDLGCTWKDISSSSKIQSNHKGLKITTGTSYGQQDTKRPKKPNCHFQRAGSKNGVPGAKAETCACPLHTPLKEGADHGSYPSGLTPRPTPTLTG